MGMQHLLSKLPQRQRANAVALLLAVATGLGGLFVSSVARDLSYKSKCAQVKQNLHAIQLAVERYSVDDPESSYPRDIRDVIRRGYLPQFPLNPFTGLPMRCIEQRSDAQKFSVDYVPPHTEPG